jgi:hypothetical protein
MGLMRRIEAPLRWFDSEDRELVLRFRLWRYRWFPSRWAELRGWDEETNQMILGPWKWQRPDRWRKR